jgi:hypothetical protein
MRNAPILSPRATSRAVPEDRLRIQHTLKRLAARGPSPWPVLSVYVNTRPVGSAMTTYRPFLKKRLTEELKAFAALPEHESLAVDAARVQHYLDYDIKEFTRATAVFACYGDNDLFDAVQIPVDFPDALVTVGPLATLYPPLRAADCYRRAAVLVCDTHSARLFSIALGAIEVRREIRAAQTPKGGDGEGTQRHADDVARRHVRLAAHALEELANEVHASWILIGADPGIAAEIDSALTPAAQERVLGRSSWDIKIAEADLSAAVAAAVDTREKAIRKERAEELVKNAPHEGAILGVGPVVEALNAARVATLLLSEAFPADAPGWSCRSCRVLGRRRRRRLPVCGKSEVQAVALREEIGSQALAQGADVHFVESRAVLGYDIGSVVASAFARYP